MTRRRAVIAGAVAATVALGVTGGAVAFAGGDDEGPPVTGPTADRAVAAALAETGGGRANAVERDSENGATFEVEVTRPDGKTVDVRLDGDYQVVIVESDSEAPGRDDAGR
jgi:Peptidase propeptide and YPEB domain